VPQQHGRIAARPLADASEVALVTGDIEGPAVRHARIRTDRTSTSSLSLTTSESMT